jgi:hypothetical protein
MVRVTADTLSRSCRLMLLNRLRHASSDDRAPAQGATRGDALADGAWLDAEAAPQIEALCVSVA